MFERSRNFYFIWNLRLCYFGLQNKIKYQGHFVYILVQISNLSPTFVGLLLSKPIEIIEYENRFPIFNPILIDF